MRAAVATGEQLRIGGAVAVPRPCRRFAVLVAAHTSSAFSTHHVTTAKPAAAIHDMAICAKATVVVAARGARVRGHHGKMFNGVTRRHGFRPRRQKGRRRNRAQWLVRCRWCRAGSARARQQPADWRRLNRSSTGRHCSFYIPRTSTISVGSGAGAPVAAPRPAARARQSWSNA